MQGRTVINGRAGIRTPVSMAPKPKMLFSRPRRPDSARQGEVALSCFFLSFSLTAS